MKKAFAWLDGHGVRYDFHDYKATGIDIGHLQKWQSRPGGKFCQYARHHLAQTVADTADTTRRSKSAKADERTSGSDSNVRYWKAVTNCWSDFHRNEYSQALGKQSGEA
jgi:hypothetical protein